MPPCRSGKAGAPADPEHRPCGDQSRRGFGILASFQSEADLRGNELAANPVPMGSVTNSQIRATH